MKLPSTVKPQSNHRHDGATVAPSPALYEKAGKVTVVKVTVVKIGRPTIYSPDFCDKVIALGKMGKSRCQIAVALGCCKRTFQTWEEKYPDFLAATTHARELAQAWWEDQGQFGIWAGSKFNANAYRLQMTNRFPDQWRDKQQLEHTLKDNAPVNAEWASTEDLRQELLRRGATLPQCGQIAITERERDF
jgi:hypothetical protein